MVIPKTLSIKSSCDGKQLNRSNTNSRKKLVYLGTRVGRDPQQFYSSLSILEQEELLENLKLDYSQILFDYFASETKIACQIDRFVNQVFALNLPVYKVVEIHCSLIDNLKRQLMLKGLRTEYLSSFRLTLIVVLAHLGETYRYAKCAESWNERSLVS